LISNPLGNVQRCPNNPQEKRTQAQAKKLRPQTEKGNKGLNENGYEEINLIRKVPRECLREQSCYEPQEEEQ